MSLNMKKQQGINRKNQRCLQLASSQPTDKPLSDLQPCDPRIQLRCAKEITVGMMNRLWIPQGTTIVGLLNLGSSKSNYEELLYWVNQQLPSLVNINSRDLMNILAKRFLRVVDNYPDIVRTQHG